MVSNDSFSNDSVNNDSVVDILLVEDNPNDAELAIRALKKNNLANHLEWVRDGAAALDFLFHRGARANSHNRLPRVVLLDLRLPKLDGIEVLTAIRANPETRELPVVVLTSSQEEQDLVATYQLGVNSFVTKPVGFDAFARTVAELGLYWVLVNRVPPDSRRDQ
ncbi:response regulator [Thiocystis violacea]|uniref:response regulator n=1 Tax=Thiocystis violacea TaxID=13725 RepID=UPI001902F424|nr:response regulator [Thiocystis violacea]MBK1721635.1 two-component system response regulator [Thiocystis violacea]